MAARIVGKRVEWSVVFSTVFESVEFGVGVWIRLLLRWSLV